MKLPSLFRREKDPLARATEDRADRLLAETLRLMGQVFTKLADLVEEERREKATGREQPHFLERLDRAEPTPVAPAPKK